GVPPDSAAAGIDVFQFRLSVPTFSSITRGCPFPFRRAGSRDPFRPRTVTAPSRARTGLRLSPGPLRQDTMAANLEPSSL
ncbi:hypothetical protein SB816_34800, partial [Achromobacter sp. SIMBA_011]|uniref:hypothetical protein n=1 Tax=Achromobacter sp. SIMBA_011 TaxID=3085759 RepID=UPI00397A63FD